MNKIIRRVLTILPAVLLQAVWLAVLFSWLAPWAAVISFALSILAFLLVLYIITKQDEGTYKIIWLLLVLTVPLPGALLYLIFGNKRTTRPLRKKLDAARPLPALPARTAAPPRPSARCRMPPASPCAPTAPLPITPWGTTCSP